MKTIDIRRLRKDHHLTQDQLAEILGCKQSFVSSIEAGKNEKKRNFPEEKIPILEKRFGDITDYITEYNQDITESEDDPSNNNISETAAYISKSSANIGGYINVPTRIFEELTKLTETIYSQQRTIEKLVNKKEMN